MRYTVIPNPAGRQRKGGYAIYDHRPNLVFGDDVEGVGWVDYHPPRAGNHVICWYKRKCDAEARAAVLNNSTSSS